MYSAAHVGTLVECRGRRGQRNAGSVDSDIHATWVTCIIQEYLGIQLLAGRSARSYQSSQQTDRDRDVTLVGRFP